jgi:hypothetical protein
MKYLNLKLAHLLWTAPGLLIGCASDMQKSPYKEVRTSSTSLAKLDADKVSKVTILYHPETSVHVQSMSHTVLEAACWARLTMQNLQSSKLKEKLFESLDQTVITPSEDVSLDVRWGCILYDRYDNRLASLYFNVDGSGLLNDTEVRTDSRFLNFLRQEFGWLSQMW